MKRTIFFFGAIFGMLGSILADEQAGASNGSADWDAKVTASKFFKFTNFGKPVKGHLCLQDHGNLVPFRNVKIKSLD